MLGVASMGEKSRYWWGRRRVDGVRLESMRWDTHAWDSGLYVDSLAPFCSIHAPRMTRRSRIASSRYEYNAAK
jgi:hypothetical protein